MSTFGDTTPESPADPSKVFGDSENTAVGDSSAVRARSSWWTSALLPPDFYPERQIDALTWSEAVFEPVALIGTVICLVLGVVSFGLVLSPGWETRYVVILAAVVALEAFFYSRRLTRSAFLFKEWLVLLAPPIVLVRFLPYLDDPNASVVTDVLTWLRDPGAIFSFAFVADVVVLLTVWWVVFACTQRLNQLRVQEGEIVERAENRYSQMFEDNWRSYDHQAPLRQLGQFYLWGGVFLVVVSALASIGTAQFLSIDALGQLIGFQRPSLHLVLANVLLYFVLGLVLIGEAQFVRQRTLWRLDHLAMPAEIASRWVSSVVGVVLIATIVALILPTSYAMTLGELISYVVYIAVEVVGFVVAGIFYLLFLISRLFPHTTGGTQPPAPALAPHFPAATTSPGGASPFDAIRSLIFWLVALGILAYSLSVLWRRRGPRVGVGALLRVLRVPIAILRWLVRIIGIAGRQVGHAVVSIVPALFRHVPTAPPAAFRFVSLSKMGPRERVEYFYLSLCERAAQLGHPRPPGVTPAEYETMLRESLPIVDPELSQVTEAFVEARYGPHPTTQSRVSAVRVQWQVLKLKLRQARVQRMKRPG